ncbi:MarR family winged helix-turn-helix transcriptional regulator [Rubinisphaera margarita]|uniref:MarR family winged helix-turn-helix transcriptional regulator n=1 Tax=Rubinisphaera margarita TaxID=2909586 RepID=UPI001EE8D683|nr:MarR family transcriptional regulator [Rubinisphaera margarita]MCG6156428.1 MarR family transcriptional regulator [Rubinisphaera margarita]
MTQRKTDVKQEPGIPAFDSTEQETFLNLWRTYDCLKAIEEQLFGQFKLTAQQYNALRLLQAAAPSPVPTLALGRKLITRAPDITRMLDRLEKRGLIQRTRRVENRRVVEVELTAEGGELLTEMADAVREMHERQLSHLTAAQQEQFVELLRLARKPHEDASCDWLEN